MEHVFIIAAELVLLGFAMGIALFNRRRIAWLKGEVAHQSELNLSQQLLLADIQMKMISGQKETVEKLMRSESVYTSQIQALKEQIESERNKRYQIEEASASQRATQIQQAADEKRQAYEKGIREGSKEFDIICQPYSIVRSGWLSKSMSTGYRFQLLVKGVPVFASKDIPLQEFDHVDENVKTQVLSLAKAAVAVIAMSKGIPIPVADTVECRNE